MQIGTNTDSRKDDLKLAALIRRFWLSQGLEGAECSRGGAPVRKTRHSCSHPDLVVLDLIAATGEDGLSICQKRWRATGYARPFLMSPPRSEDEDQHPGGWSWVC